MHTQQDLIGTIWKCPRCEEEVVITKDGVLHSCPGYWIKIRLDQLWELHISHEELRKIQNRLIYGK